MFLKKFKIKNIKIFPKTKLGGWSVFLIILMPIFFNIGTSFLEFYNSIPAGKSIPEDIIQRPGIALPMLTMFISGITAFFIGMNSIIKRKDYSIFVFLSTIIGFLVLFWCLVEIVFPH